METIKARIKVHEKVQYYCYMWTQEYKLLKLRNGYVASDYAQCEIGYWNMD